MRTKFFLLFLFAIFFSSVKAGNGQADYDKGMALFQQNKRFESIEFFVKALDDNQTRSNANLMLAIVHWCISREEASIEYMLDYVKTEPNPYPAVYALWSSGAIAQTQNHYTKKHFEFFDYVMNDPKANGTMKAMALSSAGYGYRVINDLKKSAELLNKMGVVENWQVAGTFDNYSGNGFDKDFGVLANPKADAVFKNTNGAEVGWIDLPYLRTDKWLDFDGIFVFSNSIMYAQTFLNSPEDKEVYVRIGVSGSLKCWVNDALVANVKEERNNNLDIYNYKVKINKGYNRILVQIGESEANSANFMLRITDEAGNPIQGLSTVNKYQDYQKSNAEAATMLPHFAVDHYTKLLAANPDDFLNLLLLGNAYNAQQYLYEARKTLTHASALAPNCGFVLRILLETYNNDGNQTMVTQTESEIKKIDPKNVYSLQVKIQEAFAKEDFDAAEGAINTLEDIYGEDAFIISQRIGLASRRNKYDDLAVLIERMYKLYPNNYTAVNLKFTLDFATNNNLAKCNEILKKYLKNNLNDNILTSLGNNYFKLGMKKEALQIYQSRLDLYPHSIDKMVDLVDIYYASRDYEEALKWQLKVIDRTKYWPKQYYVLGNIYESMGNTTAAIDAFQKAISYSPNYYDARESLRTLKGKKTIYANFETTDADEVFSKAPDASEFPNDNSILLLHDKQRVVYPEGASEDRTELIVKILNQQGIDVWKEYVIPFNSYTQRLVIESTIILKKDGRSVQAETNQNQIVFTSLEVGDAIQIVYRIQNYYYGKMARHFWDKHNFELFFPVVKSRYSILVPKDAKFEAKSINCDIKATTKDIEDLKLYSWEMQNLPAIIEEPMMPTLNDVGARIELSSIPDWNFVANWYSDLSTSKAKADFDVKEAVANAFKGKDIAKMKRIDKAKTIYAYLLNNISYSNVDFLQSALVPQKASKTLNYKLGDCKDYSTLFVAMGNEVGLNSQLVLVDTRSNGEKNLLVPSINFNHCVARVEVDDNKYQFVELTYNKLPFGAVTPFEYRSKALLIPFNGTATTADIVRFDNPAITPNAVSRKAVAKFDNGNMVVNKQSIKTGSYAASARYSYADIGQTEREKMILDGISSDYKTKVELRNLKFDNLTGFGDTVSYSYDYTVNNHISSFAGISIFNMPWADIIHLKDYMSLETRKYPMCLWKYFDAELMLETIELDIPAGKVLAEVPKSVKLNCANAEYSLTFTVKGQKIVAVRSLKILNDVVEPAQYAAVKDFFLKVFEADTKQLGYKDKVAAVK